MSESATTVHGRRRGRGVFGGVVAAAAALVAGLALAPPVSAQTPPTPAPLPGGPGFTTQPVRVPPQVGQAVKNRLDRLAARVPANVSTWYVDPATNQTVVTVIGQTTAAAAAFAADGNPASVRVQPFSDPVRPLAALVGGTATTSTGTRCSIGWSLRSGTTTFMLTAGHCTQGKPATAAWAGPDRRTIGSVTREEWGTSDWSTIRVADVRTWQGSSQVQGGPSATGATEAAIGEQVCRSGSTSGYRCGVIQAKNVSVNYGNGLVVRGLTQTSACAGGGDSGGSFIAPRTRQAQGILSGGNGSCSGTATSFMQPLAPILRATGATLVTTR